MPTLGLEPSDNSLLAKPEETTRFEYSVTGGRPPYAIAAALRASGGTQQPTSWITRVPREDSQFELNLADYVKDQLSAIAGALVS